MGLKKATKKIEDNVVHVEFSNGEKLEAPLVGFTDAIKERLACHGLSQKLGDSYAGAETIEAAIAAARRVLAELLAGNWTAARAAGEGGPRLTLLVEALARVASAETGTEVTIEMSTEVIEDMDDDEKKAVRGNPAVQVAINEIKLERAQTKAAKATEGGGIAELFGGDAPTPAAEESA